MLDRKAIRERFKDKTILFVDDDRQITFSWERLLGRTFGNVIIASNGKDGLEAYMSNNIDIVVSDITMPLMNGLEMARAILEHDKDCKIIFMTGHNDKEYTDQIAELGMAVLIKPVDMEEFFRVVLNTL